MTTDNIGIYMITNLINGKIYIGQSSNLKKRHNSHKFELTHNRHYNTHLQHAWNKYGPDNFHYQVIETCSKEELNELERAYITVFNSTDKNYGYNLESGGCSHQTLSEETKEKISKSMKGRIFTEEHKDRIRQAQLGEKHHQYGKPLTPEHKRKLSIAGNGREYTKDTLMKLSTTKGSTGIFHVAKTNSKRYRQGYFYRYLYRVDGKRKQISSQTLKELKEKVIAKGLEWIVFDEDLVHKTIQMEN